MLSVYIYLFILVSSWLQQLQNFINGISLAERTSEFVKTFLVDLNNTDLTAFVVTGLVVRIHIILTWIGFFIIYFFIEFFISSWINIITVLVSEPLGCFSTLDVLHGANTVFWSLIVNGKLILIDFWQLHLLFYNFLDPLSGT